jgi:hypothetical protein
LGHFNPGWAKYSLGQSAFWGLIFGITHFALAFGTSKFLGLACSRERSHLLPVWILQTA